MKEQDQIRAIAELDGKRYHKPTDEEIATGSYYQYEPDYLHSRDAIIPVIERQDSVIQSKLHKHFVESDKFWWEYTPSQLCEALLRAAGKWIE